MIDAASLSSWVESVARRTQEMVDAEFARVGTPEPGSALDQLGLRDGIEIVRDYLHHGEAGLAFDHVLYMVIELELVLPSDARELLLRAGKAMGFPDATWDRIKGANAG
jgi:hypothetical protein